MKKLLKTLIILAILVAGGLTALGFGLRSTIQEQVLNGLSNLSRSPQGKPYAASADQVFADLYQAGGIGEAGSGMIFMEKVLRGHPMMPFAGADW